MNIYDSKFMIDYKNIKGASETKYAYAMSDLRDRCCDFGCPLSTLDIEFLRDMEEGEKYKIKFPKGYAEITIERL